jgi:hypothetical protein
MADLVEFSTLKALLDLEKNNLSDYAALEAIVAAVPDTLSQYLGRELVEEDTWTLSDYIQSSTRFLDLPYLPIVSITSLVIGDLDYDSTTYTITGDGLRLKSPVSYVDYDITYVGGFESFPKDLQYAAALQAMYEYQNKDHIGAQTVSTEGGSVTTPGLKIHDEVKRRLRPYMTPRGVGVG